MKLEKFEIQKIELDDLFGIKGGNCKGTVTGPFSDGTKDWYDGPDCCER